MARQNLSLSGLEISQQQLRVVELRQDRNGLSLEAVAIQPTPTGAIVNGKVLDPEVLGAAVRNLFDTNGIKTRTVVIGVPGNQVASRISRVPATSPGEMRTLVEGEIEHYRLLPGGRGTFDFVTLHQQAQGDEAGDGGSNILLMAMEEEAVETYTLTARAAGLQLVALEPTPIASVRALYPYLAAQPTTALISVGEHSTTLCILHGGALAYYRVIEGGTLTGRGDSDALRELVHELRRSLEFYHRQLSGGDLVSQVQVAVDLGQLRDLNAYLEDELGIPVEMRHPFAYVQHDTRRYTAEFLQDSGPSFTAAYGLALHEMDDGLIARAGQAGVTVEQLPALPRIDLSTREKEKRTLRAGRQTLLISAAAAVLILVGSVILGKVLEAGMDQTERDLTRTEAQLSNVNRAIEQQHALGGQALEATRQAAEKGKKYSQLLSQLGAATPTGAWLTTLNSEADNSILVEGQAESVALIVTTLRQLSQSQPRLAPRLVSVHGESEGKRTVFNFEIRLRGTAEAEEKTR